MKTIFLGLLLIMSQVSLAGESCALSISLAANASKVIARLLDKPGEYVNIPLEGKRSCSEHFLTILKEGQKFTEIEGIKIPIEYHFNLGPNESDSYLEAVSANAKIGDFEVIITEDATSVKAIAKNI